MLWLVVGGRCWVETCLWIVVVRWVGLWWVMVGGVALVEVVNCAWVVNGLG